MTAIVGIDPGVQPVMCYLNGAQVLFNSETSVKVKRGKSIKREPEAHLIAAILKRWAPDLVIIERVHGRPGESVAAVGSFMRARGVLEGCCAGLGFAFELVDPSRWTRDLKLKKGEDAGRQMALQVLPSLADELAHKSDHNKADAFLLAVWGHKFSAHPFL